jgi:acetylornithine/N-succinyldiaminopimelate aminotransferase
VISEVMPSYGRADLAFERGEGAYLFSTDGKSYLDFAAGVAVNALGHNHPRLVKALTDQAGKLWHVSNLYRVPEQEELARKLVAASFADSAFFCNSGAEAVEAGIKIVRKYQSATGHPERYRIISFDSSFHGRTLSTIAAANNAAHVSGFGPMPDGFDQVSFGNLNELRNAITPETAGIIVEPIQGEGGIRPSNAEFLQGLREACDEFGLLLFFDEVQTGIGRAGKLFAYENFGVEPDVMSLAKGLGGGFPVGACLATKAAAVGITPGTHGSTFGGNPLAMAVANTIIDILQEDGFLAGVREMGELLFARMVKFSGEHPGAFEDVRGAGMMIGLKCIPPAGDFVAACREEGLLTVPAGDNVLRLLPPLIIDETHIAECVEMMGRAWKRLSS